VICTANFTVRSHAISPRPRVSTSPTSSRTYPDRLEDRARRLQAAMANSSNPLSSTRKSAQARVGSAYQETLEVY